ncbi:MAG: UDP-3-O-(3-hydroxymyristoyl)glucosamine N-acyltransferase [Pseudomonadota bacterium]
MPQCSATNPPLTTGEIARRLGARLDGPDDRPIVRLAPLTDADPESLSFVTDPARDAARLAESRAGAILVPADWRGPDAGSAAWLMVPDVYLAYARASQWWGERRRARGGGVHPSAVVDRSAQIDPGAWIGPGVVIGMDAVVGAGSVIEAHSVIGARARIGADTFLHPRVTLLDDTRVGDRVILHSGVVLGADGFGFAADAGAWCKIEQLGGVRVGDDCEIGANTTIDRGALRDTAIGNGVKIDDQVHVAHNVEIGDHTAIAGCVGIAGSARIGCHCAIGGGAGILGHLAITDHVTIHAMTLVTRSITRSGHYASGVPHQEARLWNRMLARLRRLARVHGAITRDA